MKQSVIPALMAWYKVAVQYMGSLAITAYTIYKIQNTVMREYYAILHCWRCWVWMGPEDRDSVLYLERAWYVSMGV